MSAQALSSTRRVLADAVFPTVAWRNVVLVGGGVLLVALLAQVRIPLGFTPVPLTLQTLGVALVGASLGLRRGSVSLLLYVLLGAVGLPFYAGGQGGVEHVLGPTGGYLLGFVPAAALVGWLASLRADRRPWTAFLTFQAGSLVVFACGLVGLMFSLGMPLGDAVRAGWLPFIPGDLLKTALAAGLLPAAWAAIDRFTRSA